MIAIHNKYCCPGQKKTHNSSSWIKKRKKKNLTIEFQHMKENQTDL